MKRDTVLIYGLFALLVTPLIFGTERLFPFVTYRTFFFFLGIEFLWPVFLSRYGLSWISLIRKNLVILLFLFFLVVKGLSDILNPYPTFNIMGNFERMMGLFTWLHVASYIIFITVVFRDPGYYKRLFRVAAIVGTFVAIYGLLQKFGIAFRIRDIDERLFSTIGNPAFLAGFLVLSATFTTFALKEGKGKTSKFFWSMCLFFQTVAIYLTATRGALVGIFGGIVVAILLLLYSSRKLLTRSRIYILFAVIIFFCLSPFVLYALRSSPLVTDSTTLRRLTTISLSDFSTQSRLLVWKVALRSFRDHPILGYGENMVALALDRHYDPRIAEPWFDSTHNVFLDILVGHGVLGIFSYLALLLVLFRTYWRYRLSDHIDSAIFIGGLSAYLIQAVFIFDTLVVLLFFSLFIGFAAVVGNGVWQPPSSSKRTRVLSVSIATIFVLISFVVLIRSWRALAIVSEAKHTVGTISLDETIGYLFLAHNTTFFGFGNIATVAGNVSRSVMGDTDYSLVQRREFLDVTDLLYRLAREREGEHSRWYIDMAKVYLDVPSDLGSYHNAALVLLSEAKRQSSRRIDIDFARAEAYLRLKQYDVVTNLFETMIQEYPERRSAVFVAFATFGLGTDDPTTAFLYVQKALDAGEYLSPSFLEQFAQLFVHHAAWDKALYIFEKMRLSDPENISILANIAQVYKRQGEMKKARMAAEEIRHLDPSQTSIVDEFIASLDFF